MLSAPFPWFGSKRRIASRVWARFGDVPNYVEPFYGGGAIHLGRPHEPSREREETVSDLNCWLANFWRAVKLDPQGVADAAAWPISEPDLAARHAWFRQAEDLRALIYADADFCDVKAAGWWVWGLCASIGGAWNRDTPQRPAAWQRGNGRIGILGLADPHRTLSALQWRLRNVRIMCGDWTRAVAPSRVSADCNAVLLDPPYGGDLDRPYGEAGSCENVAARAREWALAHGDSPRFRIALCGLDGEHDMPSTWTAERWEGHGGFGRRVQSGRGRENAARETVWFSPHCLTPRQPEDRDPDALDLFQLAYA